MLVALTLATARSRLAALQPVDEAGDHAGDFFEVGFEFGVLGLVDRPAPAGNLNQRDAFLHGTADDGEEELPVGSGKAPVAFSQIGGDGESRAGSLR